MNSNETTIIVRNEEDIKKGIESVVSNNEYRKTSFLGLTIRFIINISFYKKKNQIVEFIKNKKPTNSNYEVIFVNEIEITNNKDFECFEKYVEIINEEEHIKKNLQSNSFLFTVDFSKMEYFNEQIIHNYLVLYKKFNQECKLWMDLVLTDKIGANTTRIRYYLFNLNKEVTDSFCINGFKLYMNEVVSGRILPATYVDSDTLLFLENPIKPSTWEKMIYGEINEKSFDEDSMEGRHWRLLAVCQFYLKNAYDNASHKSKELLNIKKELICSKKFYEEHASLMPFLAFLIFVQYDFYYRSYLLNMYIEMIISEKKEEEKREVANSTELDEKQKKEKIESIDKERKNIQLKEEDFILEKQKNQKGIHYQVYRKLCKDNKGDIKTIIKYKDCIEEKDKNPIYLEDPLKQITIHESLIDEMLESMTITEGLLQLLDNSVRYAGGGLISIRIRQYDDNNSNYFDSKYGKYFEKNKPNDKFFLEIKISDRSIFNMKEVFIHNVDKRIEANPELDSLKKWWLENRNEIMDEKNPYNLFFNNIGTKMREYYSFSDNRVHHFGLEIFESLVKSKKGWMNVSGHGYQCGNEEGVAGDLNSKGLVYEVLMPIGNKEQVKHNVIIDTNYENLMQYYELNNFKTNGKLNIFTINEKDINECLNKSCSKEMSIILIEKLINKITTGKNKGILLIDTSLIEDVSYFKIEALIKGLLCFLCKNTGEIGVYIKLSSSHEFLEVVRLFSIFYDRNGKADERMDKMQVYVIGKETGEEVLFAGNDLAKNVERIKRMAMTRGLMSDCQFVINKMLERVKEQNHE